MKPDLIILDGGMGGEILRRAGRSELWSAQALLDAPDLVAGVHRDYIDAGAEIIITNTYSTIPSYLAKAGLEGRYVELAELAGRIARQQADAAPHPVQVAGSLPPLDESYRHDLVPSDEAARPIYRTLAQTLKPFVDLFLCETMSSVRETRNAATQALEVSNGDLPVLVSWTLDERAGCGLRSGESVAEAVAALDDLDIAGFMFNCTSPEAILAGLEELTTLTDKPIGAYPNALHIPPGWTLDNDIEAGYEELDVATFVDWAERWSATGAAIIGGCCGIGPDHIRGLADARRHPADAR